jgi:hypothetical protein
MGVVVRVLQRRLSGQDHWDLARPHRASPSADRCRPTVTDFLEAIIEV